MFYTFSQNNSGGSFTFNAEAGISHYVIIEADDLAEAMGKAEEIGLYFDGAGDCPCCGNRWYEPWEVSEKPEIYGEPVTEDWKCNKWMGDNPEAFIHYKNGKIKPIQG